MTETDLEGQKSCPKRASNAFAKLSIPFGPNVSISTTGAVKLAGKVRRTSKGLQYARSRTQTANHDAKSKLLQPKSTYAGSDLTVPPTRTENETASGTEPDPLSEPQLIGFQPGSTVASLSGPDLVASLPSPEPNPEAFGSQSVAPLTTPQLSSGSLPVVPDGSQLLVPPPESPPVLDSPVPQPPTYSWFLPIVPHGSRFVDIRLSLPPILDAPEHQLTSGKIPYSEVSLFGPPGGPYGPFKGELPTAEEVLDYVGERGTSFKKLYLAYYDWSEKGKRYGLESIFQQPIDHIEDHPITKIMIKYYNEIAKERKCQRRREETADLQERTKNFDERNAKIAEWNESVPTWGRYVRAQRHHYSQHDGHHEEHKRTPRQSTRLPDQDFRGDYHERRPDSPLFSDNGFYDERSDSSVRIPRRKPRARSLEHADDSWMRKPP